MYKITQLIGIKIILLKLITITINIKMKGVAEKLSKLNLASDLLK